MVEYFESAGSSALLYSRSYVYAGSRLLMTATSVGTNGGAEITEFHHPDRLGTKLVTNPSTDFDTNPAGIVSYEQSTLPFGTALNGESTGYANQTFTSYDRSATTGLDYAVNRTYSSGQGSFGQVDPIGMSAASAGDPQSNNLYAYVQNNPTESVDPGGLITCFQATWGTRWYSGDSVVYERISGSSVVCLDIGADSVGSHVRTPGEIERGGGGGGRGGRNGRLPSYISELYQGKMGKKLTECINKVFAKKVTITDSRGRTYQVKGSDFVSSP